MKKLALVLAFLIGSVASAFAACTSPAVMHDFPGTSFNMSLATVPDGNCGSNVALPTWAGGTLGAMANYGTSPGAVLVPGVNAFITNVPSVAQSGAPWSQNLTQWNSVALGSPSAYGTSPGAVTVPGVNAFVTNTLAAGNTNADAVAVGTLNASPVQGYGFVFNGTTWDRMRSGTQTGSVAVASSDPCLGANKTNLPISQSGTSSVQLVGLSGSTVIYVCSLSLVAAGATTMVLTTGTGSACVTGNAAVLGDTTANIANGLSFAANGGLTLGNGAGTIAKGAASSELCMTLGTNVRMSGNLTYVQQ